MAGSRHTSEETGFAWRRQVTKGNCIVAREKRVCAAFRDAEPKTARFAVVFLGL